MSKGVQIAIGVATALVGLAAVLKLGASDEGTFSYYASVDAFLSAPAAPAARGQRVHGFVVAGSIARDLVAGHVDFRIADQGSSQELKVRYHGIDTPDLFRDGAEVVVEGRVTPAQGAGEGAARSGVFDARRVLAKCPSKYEARPGQEA
jgi:cytochrome c-type biogenesis protein CcmE